MRRWTKGIESKTTDATSVHVDMPPPVTMGLGDAPNVRIPITPTSTRVLGDGLIEAVVYVLRFDRSLPAVSTVGAKTGKTCRVGGLIACGAVVFRWSVHVATTANSAIRALFFRKVRTFIPKALYVSSCEVRWVGAVHAGRRACNPDTAPKPLTNVMQ